METLIRYRKGYPANYCECITETEVKKIKIKQLKKPNIPKQPQRHTQPKTSTALTHHGNGAKGKTDSQPVSGKIDKLRVIHIF